jgi:copper transport protein
MRSRIAVPLLLLALVVGTAVAPLMSGTAYAHAALVRANPANNETLARPPARVVLWFSEAIEQKLTQIQVVDKDGGRVDGGDMAFDPNDDTFASVGVKTLPPGLYYVRWSNVSKVDGHNLRGSYPFIVLNPDRTFPAGVSLDSATTQTTTGGSLLPSNLDVTLKWIALLSLAAVAGAAFFLFAVIRPAAAFLEEHAYHQAIDVGERWVINIAHVLLPASFIASAFLMLVTVNRFETSTSAWTYITTVRTGEYRAAQLVLLAVALAGADLLFLGNSSRKRGAGLFVLLAASIAAMFTYSMISHGASGRGEFWSVASDFTHLLASSTWLGALVMLPALMFWVRRAFDETPRFLYLANAFDRFSVVAGVSVIVVLATGTFNGLAQVPTAGAMIDTTYGKVLLAKLALLAPLLAIAGLNAFVLKPRLVSVIDDLYQEGGSASEHDRATQSRRLASLQRALPITVAVEIALVLAVFAAVAVLGQTSTARGEVAQVRAQKAAPAKFNQAAHAADLNLTLEVSPNRVGINEYTLSIQNKDGTPSETVTQARLRFNYDEVQGAVAPSEVILNKFAPGEYRGAGAYFSQPGNWRVEADVRRSDADDVSHAYVLPVAAAAETAKQSQGGIWSLPFTVFNWNQVAGAFLALAGAVVVIYRRQLRILEPSAYRAGIAVAMLLMLGGAVLAFGVGQHAAARNPTAGNPVKPTKDSVERGKTLFQQNCIACHGIDGRGDGPEAPNLSPAPTDFRLHMPLHTDPQFYGFIADGYPGSAMPRFRDAFSEEDIWNLVNYLRSAFSEAPTQ